MAELRLPFKFILFFSGYFPLFLIFSLIKSNDLISVYLLWIGKNTVFNPVGMFIILLDILSIFSIAVTVWMLKIPSDLTNPNSFYPISVKNENSSHLEYLMTYILPVLTININSIDDNVYFEMFAFIIVLLITFIIYSKSRLMHSNIVFLILGYNLFKMTNSNQEEIMVISKKNEHFINKTIYLYPVNSAKDDFFIAIGVS